MLKLKTNDILSRMFFVMRKGIFLPTGGSLTASSSLYPQDANSTTPPFVITEYILRQYLYEQIPPPNLTYTPVEKHCPKGNSTQDRWKEIRGGGKRDARS